MLDLGAFPVVLPSRAHMEVLESEIKPVSPFNPDEVPRYTVHLSTFSASPYMCSRIKHYSCSSFHPVVAPRVYAFHVKDVPDDPFNRPLVQLLRELLGPGVVPCMNPAHTPARPLLFHYPTLWPVFVRKRHRALHRPIQQVARISPIRITFLPHFWLFRGTAVSVLKDEVKELGGMRRGLGQLVTGKHGNETG
jgi:hypothetical protein